MGLPFSGLLAGEGLGCPCWRVSLPALARQMSRHANEACTRQPHHPPSTVLEAIRGRQVKAIIDSRDIRSASSKAAVGFSDLAVGYVATILAKWAPANEQEPVLGSGS